MSPPNFSLRTAVCLLLAVSGNALAKTSFVRRQNSSSTDNGTETTSSAPSQVLTPVVPPVVDSSSLQILTPQKNVSLFFQSTSTSRKRDSNVVSAQVDFAFRYPTVPLDHSDFVGNVSCTDTTVLASFADSAGYSHAVSTWPKKSDFLLITATAGCGSNDTQNGYFIATSAAFDSSSSSVTAQGSFVRLNNTYQSTHIVWGSTNTTDPSSRRLRARQSDSDDDDNCDDDWCASATWSFNLSPEIAVGLLAGDDQEDAEANASSEDDDDAPWENAFLLWSSDDGEDETGGDNGSTGDEKRSLESREAKAGFNLYCVDCGVQGTFTLGGVIDYCIFTCPLDPGITKAQVYLTGNIEAGLYIGLEAFAEYSKTWTKELAKPNLLGWEILDLVNVGPYIELDVTAKFDAKAEGTLLVGGGLEWPVFSAQLDVLDESNSFVNGFDNPSITEKLEAKGELSISASLGFPLSIGVGIDVDDGDYKADLALQNTPSINAEASISISYIDDNTYSPVDGTTIEGDNNGLNINDGCYGVDWSLTFVNSIDFVAELDGVDGSPWDWNLFTWSYPLAQGCFGYQQLMCTAPIVPSPVVADGVSCNLEIDYMDTGSSDYTDGDATTADSLNMCAGTCMMDSKCLSFTWDGSSNCQFYTASITTLIPFAAGGGSLQLFDRNCWQTSDCPFNATNPDLSGTTRKGRRNLGGVYDANSGVYLQSV